MSGGGGPEARNEKRLGSVRDGVVREGRVSDVFGAVWSGKETCGKSADRAQGDKRGKWKKKGRRVGE